MATDPQMRTGRAVWFEEGDGVAAAGDERARRQVGHVGDRPCGVVDDGAGVVTDLGVAPEDPAGGRPRGCE